MYQRYSPGEAPDVEKLNKDPLQKEPTVGIAGSEGIALIVAMTSVRVVLSHVPSLMVTK
jgi:hypothetical protein